MVELARLESVYGRKVIEGSNPSLSANFQRLAPSKVMEIGEKDANPQGSADEPRR